MASPAPAPHDLSSTRAGELAGAMQKAAHAATSGEGEIAADDVGQTAAAEELDGSKTPPAG